MRRYEQVYILRPSLSEEQITKITDNTNQLILDDNGAIIFLNKWGMKKLAYPIKKEIQGYYVLCDFAASPEVVSEIERKFRIDDSILKYLTIKISDSITAEEIDVAQSEAEAKAIVPEPEEESVETAKEKTVEKTKEEPAKAVAEEPVETAEETSDKAVEEAVEESAETADDAADEVVEEAVEEPAETVDDAADEVAEDAVEESTETVDEAEASSEDSEVKTQ